MKVLATNAHAPHRRPIKRSTAAIRRKKHTLLHEETTKSEASLEPGELLEIYPSPYKESNLLAVTTLYDLTRRKSYRDDVLLCSLTLFKRLLGVGLPAFMPALLASCFRLAAQLLENNPPTHSELVSACLYKFTKEELVEAEVTVLQAVDFDICCRFSDDLREQLRQKLRTLHVRLADEQPHLLIFSNF